MTYEEAKQNISNTHIQFGRSNGKTVFNDSLSMAIKAIDKQIPKKPIPHKVDVENVKIGNVLWGKNTTVYRCPCCDELISRVYDYCYKCGQAIDWSE